MKKNTPHKVGWLALAGLMASAAFFFTGCGRGDASADGERKLVVGFSQIGAESAWRTAETRSVQEEARKRGIDLRFSDAQQRQENQIRAIRGFIAQGVDYIILAPVVETGWEPVLREAQRANIPVILADRSIDVEDHDLYLTLVSPNMVEEGRAAARFLVEATGGKANIAELVGTPGSSPARDRAQGFREILQQHPEMRITRSQTGDFTRSGGREVMEAFLRRGDKFDALFAHNDDMALGAIQAIEDAGLRPSEDIVIVSIDAVRGAFEAMVAGKKNATVECNPLLGPTIFDVIEKHAKGETPEKRIAMDTLVFTKEQAPELIAGRQY
jgi:galactofuranose transport system substrate-binding protein